MKNLKKTLVMCICLVLIAVMAIGGTVAYLTVDPIEKGNVFSVGNIAINLTEDVGTTGAATVTSDDNGATYENVMPGDYLKKAVAIENTGSRPAFVAVEVTINNALEINKAIDEFYEAKGYSEAEIQAIYDYIFDGFGMNYTKTDANGNATGMRLTITGDKMPEKVLQVDSVKTIHEYWQQYSGNWFMDEKTNVAAIGDAYDGYYTTGMNDYELRYTYYLYLEKDEKTVLFKGLNVPKEFNAQQLAMFENMNIKVVASAIQADSFADAKDAVGTIALEDDAKFIAGAKEAFTVLNRINNGEEMDLKFVSKWDGTADTTWYDPANPQTEYKLNTAAQLAGLSELVDAGNTFEGKTIKLEGDVDLLLLDENGERVSFEPIGYGYNTVFKGTFDGQGNTISNLYQNGWDLGLDYSTEGGGLFASVVDATIKNVTLDKAEIVMECIDMGALVGYSYGNCTYENITISNSSVANYNRYTGGVVGEVNGTQVFKNVDVIDTTVAALWGTPDASLGGIIGGKWGDAQITFEDCDVSAKLSAFNDVCANYQYWNYRLCGMLIGMSEEVTNGFATASYLTAKNCTVTYGDWVNYTYCEFEANGKGSYNGPGEWKFSRVQEGCQYGGVDANHTHDTDESHEELIVFDQLFGGDKGVKGGKTHAGVTVIY